MNRLTEGEQNRLIISHMSVVCCVASRHRSTTIPFDEIEAAGRVGLVRAARSYDADRGEFFPWAFGTIESEILTFKRSWRAKWYPQPSDAPLEPSDGVKIEHVFTWSAWGGFHNMAARYEGWETLDTTPDELAAEFAKIADRSSEFQAAFIPLTVTQRKLVRAVFLQEPPVSLAQAARDRGISYWRAGRTLKAALRTMQDVIARMDKNRRTVRRETADVPPPAFMIAERTPFGLQGHRVLYSCPHT